MAILLRNRYAIAERLETSITFTSRMYGSISQLGRYVCSSLQLERCLSTCKTLCDALDSDSEELFRTDDECLREIIHEAGAKFGARNMYAAFLYLSGNVEAADLHLQAHRFLAEEAMQEIDKMLKRQN
jgi:hypothetical protein